VIREPISFFRRLTLGFSRGERPENRTGLPFSVSFHIDKDQLVAWEHAGRILGSPKMALIIGLWAVYLVRRIPKTPTEKREAEAILWEAERLTRAPFWPASRRQHLYLNGRTIIRITERLHPLFKNPSTLYRVAIVFACRIAASIDASETPSTGESMKKAPTFTRLTRNDLLQVVKNMDPTAADHKEMLGVVKKKILPYRENTF
jgi:hypothetical protein